MRKVFLALLIGLFVCTGQAWAGFVGEFNPKGNIQFFQPALGGSGELFFHLGSDNDLDPSVFDLLSFNSVPGFDMNAVHQFRFDWETIGFNDLPSKFNSGSIFWTGSLMDFFDRDYATPITNVSLFVSGQEISVNSFYPENGNGHVFVADFGVTGQTDPINLSKAEINVVPIPAAVWLLGSGLAGVVALRRKVQR